MTPMGTGPARRPRLRRLWRRGVVLFAAAVALIGLFAPLLANDVPLCARVAGAWSFPAFADYAGAPPPGPGDLTWKQWLAQLPAGSADFAIMPPWPHGPAETDPARFRAGPSPAHPFGSDDSGRDLLARLVHGAGTALGIGGSAVAIAALLGSLLGALAGYRRGLADLLVLRLIEVFLCFPMLLFLLFAAAFFGESGLGLVLVMASLFWTSFARIVRGELLSLRERDFVTVARCLGVSDRRILFRHLLPLLRSQIGVTAAFCMASAIVAESTLSFLGLGPGQTGCSWGGMLREGSAAAHLGVWHLWLFPTAAIVATVMCCHVLADRLRPRTGAEA
ncbi:MAG: ABC transporter permease [Planctomycetes bacterium]|nr:ABC transporter permease [Planctomycetota bacterium]